MSAGVLLLLLGFAEPAQEACAFGDGCPVAAAAAAAAAGPLLEFAPAAGTGMGTECACAAVTGSAGETLTFTRASSAACSKADGTVVFCGNNLPRVESVGGVLGLRVEGAATNVALRSEAFDNAAWVKEGNVVAAPSVTANTTVAPDGTTTADTIDFPAVPSGSNQISQIKQDVTTASSIATCSFWMKATAPGDVYIWLYDGTATNTSSRKTLTTSWARYSVTSSGASTAWTCHIGANTWGPAHAAIDAITVHTWGGQIEVGPTASSYIATADSTATRAAELARLPWPAGLTNTVGCYGVTFRKDGTDGTLPTPIGGQGNTTGIFMSTGDPTSFAGHDGANTSARSGFASVVGRDVRGIVDWSGTTLGFTIEGTRSTVPGPYDGTVVGTTFNLGSLDGTSRFLGGVISRVKAHSTISGCAL